MSISNKKVSFLILYEAKKKPSNSAIKLWAFCFRKMNCINFTKGQNGTRKKEIGLYRFSHSIQRIKTSSFLQLMRNKELSNQKMKGKSILLEEILKNMYRSNLENQEILGILTNINKVSSINLNILIWSFTLQIDANISKC
jgi:hypothetical protein